MAESRVRLGPACGDKPSALSETPIGQFNGRQTCYKNVTLVIHLPSTSNPVHDGPKCFNIRIDLGIVTRVGSNCTTSGPGDRVCAAIVGCIYTYARCHFQLAVKIPDDLSFAQAASLPITGVTAHHSLITVANLQREDTILIHSGAGGTGQMAIQIAQSIGSEVFVTVSSKEKLLLLMDVYHIPSDHIFYSRDASFAQDIMRMTQNRGVDVILNSLSGESLVASWECMAPFGRFVELGKADVESNSKLPMSCFAKNVSFSAVAVDFIYANWPDLLRRSLVAILERIEEGKMKIASPLHEFPISDIEMALRFMQGGKKIGKTVLNLNPTDTVLMLLGYKLSYSLDPSATYLIAGGLEVWAVAQLVGWQDEAQEI